MRPWHLACRDVTFAVLMLWTGLAGAGDVWTHDVGVVDPANYHGETVANGMIGVVSGSAPFSITRILLNGAYDVPERGAVSAFFPVFNPLAITLTIDQEAIGSPSVRQSLDMKRAVLTTVFDVGQKATITYSLRALRQLPYSVLLDVVVQARQPCELGVESSIDVPGAVKEAQHQIGRLEPQTLVAAGRSPSGTLVVSAASRLLFEPSGGKDPPLTLDGGGVGVNASFQKTLQAGEQYHFALVGSVLTSANASDPLNDVQRVTRLAEIQGIKSLVDAHEQAWAALWRSDIQIQGDDASNRAIHTMLYHLYSYAREGSGYSIAPMGLTGLGYNGHIFWDAETWMFPALLALQPNIAKSMLDYRYQRLRAAQLNALQYGYRGALFPWESAATGGEEDPMCCLPFEQHINGDVALAAWNYYLVTGDLDWLREKGYPLLRATADFWASRVQRNGPGHYDITHVVAADEYAPDADNDAFTNAVARANLEYAAAAARILHLRPDPDWKLVRDNIPILFFPDGVVREHAAYHGEIVKQADVELLSYPLHEITAPAVIRKNLAYYEQRVPGGPAMTKSIWAILYSRLGSAQEAYAAFKAAYLPNLQPPFDAFGEEAGPSEVYFATGAGGVLQAMLYGFGGLDITEQGLVQKPTTLPAAWQSVRLTGVGPQRRDYAVSAKGY